MTDAILTMIVVEHANDIRFVYFVHFQITVQSTGNTSLQKNFDADKTSRVLSGTRAMLHSFDHAIRSVGIPRSENGEPLIPRSVWLLSSLDWIGTGRIRGELLLVKAVGPGPVMYSNIPTAIDVERMRIVQLRDGQENVALSCIWSIPVSSLWQPGTYIISAD